MCSMYDDPSMIDAPTGPWATEPTPTDHPVTSIQIEGSFNEHALAADLVRYGHALIARVVDPRFPGYVSFEAYRVNPTSASYAWRTPTTMAVPAFMLVEPDPRPGVYGMPRWQWDLLARKGVVIQ